MNNDSFSWRRVRMVGAYYYPNLKYQILAYPLLGLSIAVISYLLAQSEIGFLFASFISLILTAGLAFGPLIFIRRSNRVFETMLPATGAEKSVFIVCYCLIAIPLLLQGVNWLVGEALEGMFGTPPFIIEVNEMAAKFMDPFQSFFYNLTNTYIAPATCMFAVFALRRNRMMAIVWTIVPSIVLMIAGVIFGLITAFSAGFGDAIESAASCNVVEQEEMAELMIKDLLKPMLLVFSTISIAYIGTMIWLTVKKISRIQI